MYRNVHECTFNECGYRVAREASNGFRLVLDEATEAKLADFCAAHYDGTKTKVIHEALEFFIESRLADPDEAAMRRRYEALQAKRLAARPPDS